MASARPLPSLSLRASRANAFLGAKGHLWLTKREEAKRGIGNQDRPHFGEQGETLVETLPVTPHQRHVGMVSQYGAGLFAGIPDPSLSLSEEALLP